MLRSQFVIVAISEQCFAANFVVCRQFFNEWDEFFCLWTTTTVRGAKRAVLEFYRRAYCTLLSLLLRYDVPVMLLRIKIVS